MAKKSSASWRTKKEVVKSKTNHVILGLVFILIALVSLGGAIGGAGIGGMILWRGARLLLGAGALMLPLGLLTSGILIVRKKSISVTTRESVSGSIGLLSLLGLLSFFGGQDGGFVGQLIKFPFVTLFDKAFGVLILGVVSVGSLIVFFDRTPNLFPHFVAIWEKIKSFFKKKESQTEEGSFFGQTILPEEVASVPESPQTEAVKTNNSSAEEEFTIPLPKRRPSVGYTPPPLSLLEKDRGKANVGDVKANANIIKRTLAEFGIEVEMDEITIGPTVTRYALKPAQGVKLARIVGLQNDLALALAAHPIRIEAPIPGKSLVGIEIPNRTKTIIGLSGLLSDSSFTENHKPLLVAFGRNISGKVVVDSLSKMPHLLIAGTTGSGKSVTIHAIITSLLYRHGPDDMRFIFVDPKRVELPLYNGIPHLLTPVITDAKKAILSLKWAAAEMNRRYDILEAESVRDVDSYHKKHESEFSKGANATEDGPDRMPYIVIIIDELADIMQAYPRELEAAIVRLAQMSRAVGIHLILSTQRPEVNVITGLIKANIPSRIALRVPTGIDSRTILDTVGAEKLLGQGDMLAMIGDNQPRRLQSAFITEEEVKAVVKFLKEEFKDDVRDTIQFTGQMTGEKSLFGDGIADSDTDTDDALYEDARAVIIEAGKGSTSYLQRKLKVGYARAARLMDMLEERGVIGGADGAKPREVLDAGGKQSTADDVAEEIGV
ncbi:MAG: DNA translocase FtsK [Patescibacteria group bacterium]